MVLAHHTSVNNRTTLLATALVLILHSSSEVSAQLSVGDIRRVDSAAAAWRAGRLRQAVQLLQPLLEKRTEGQLQAADQRLHDRHDIAATVVELVAAGRVTLAQEGRASRLPRPGPRELPLALTGLARRAAELTAPAEEELQKGYPAPMPDEVVEQVVELVAGLLPQLQRADRIVEHLSQLTARLRPSVIEGLEPPARAIAHKDWAGERRRLERLHDRLVARLIELSLVRLDNAVRELSDQAADFRRRFQAAERSADSVATLRQHWDRYRRWRKQRDGRLPVAEEQRWQAAETRFRHQAAPLLQKIDLFLRAKRWWLRGRFGTGPLADGLAKTLPSRAATPAVMNALLNYPLAIRQPLVKPLDPLTHSTYWHVPRRHLRWWRYRTHILSMSVSSNGDRPMTTVMMTQVGPCPMGQSMGRGQRLKYEPRFMDPVPACLRRAQIVGYLEYQQALKDFERLIALSAPAELRVLDDMIASDDRFVVYSDLSSQFDELEPSSSLRLPQRPPHPKAAGPHERRGLAWVMALARVEVGAIRAGFSETPHPLKYGLEAALVTGRLPRFPRPFFASPPTPFERDAFLELMLDGARQHYYELQTWFRPPVDLTPTVPNRAASVGNLPVFRKLTVAIQMLAAFERLAGGSLSTRQQAELHRWQIRMEHHYYTLLRRLFPEIARPIMPDVRPP